MAIRFTPMPAEKQWAIQQAHHEWTLQQVAAGVDGPVPAGRPNPSDWNQHVPDLEASGEALDAYFAKLREIIGESQ